MKITTKYLFHVVGEDTAQFPRLHQSTIKRIKAFAIAIHIPIVLWAVTGYVVAFKIFELGDEISKAVSIFCAVLIYLVERLVIATPKVWFVNLGRVLIGLVIAILGASTVDLVVFDREITQQLISMERSRIARTYDQQLAEQAALVQSTKNDWFQAQAAANCEANGTCGSGKKSVGPIYRELAKQAELLRMDHIAALNELNFLQSSTKNALSSDPTYVSSQAGLLTRIEALHQYAMANKAALVAWVLFFLLVFMFEMMVVISKLVFSETVDDRINAIREEINDHKAASFKAILTSPVANANRLIEGVYEFSAR